MKYRGPFHRLLMAIVMALGAWCGGTPKASFAETCKLFAPDYSVTLIEGIHGFHLQHSIPAVWWDETGKHESSCAAPYGTKQVTLDVRLLHAPGPGSLTLWPFTYYDNGWKGTPMPSTPQIKWTGASRRRIHRVTVGLGLDWLPPDLMVLVVSPGGPIHVSMDLVQ